MSKKPKFEFGEPAEQLQRNAEAVQAKFADAPTTSKQGGATVTPATGKRQVNVRLPKDLTLEAEQQILVEKSREGRFQSMTALVEHGLRLALADLRKQQK